MKKLLYIRSTSVKFEPVIKKKAFIAYQCGFMPYIVYWDRLINDRPYKKDFIRYIPLYIGKTSYGKGIFNIYKRFLFTFALIRTLVKLKPEVIHACDLDTALPALLFKILFQKNTVIIYDILDFIQIFSSPIPSLLRRIMDRLDRYVRKASDIIIIADENRANFIEKEFKSKKRIIYNTPDITFCYLPLYDSDVDSKRIELLYIGGMSRDRGIEILLQAVKELPEKVTLTIGGQGVLSDIVRNYSFECKNIHYLGHVNYDKVLQLTSRADILYAVYNPAFTINRFASPNKFFEAAAYGKPIIVAEGSGIDEKVRKYDMGYLINYSLESLKDVIKAFNKEELMQKGYRASLAYDHYNWFDMKSRLTNIYLQCMKGIPNEWS